MATDLEAHAGEHRILEHVVAGEGKAAILLQLPSASS
jgi:hypothetical protein